VEATTVEATTVEAIVEVEIHCGGHDREVAPAFGELDQRGMRRGARKDHLDDHLVRRQAVV